MPLHRPFAFAARAALRQTTTTSIAAAAVTNTTTRVSRSPAPANSNASSWTMDSVIMGVVAVFYFAVTAAAAVYFVNRWRRRAYGPGSPTLRGGAATTAAASREERAALRGDGSAAADAGFLATIGAMIDRVMNRSALDGAAVWQDTSRHRSRSPGNRFRPGAGNALLRKIAPYLPGAQGRAAAARRNKERNEAAAEEVNVEVSAAGGGGGVGSPAGRFTGASSPAPGGEGGAVVPPSGMPSTMTARDQAH